MQIFYQLSSLFRLIPVKARWLGSFFIILPLVFVLSRALGLRSSVTYWVVGGVFVLMLLIWGVGSLRNVGKRSRSNQFESALDQHSREGPASPEEIREAVHELKGQWDNALREFKSRGKSIYELPWFLLIGEPQSGKSTTLRESDMEFPIGQEAISGAGGTRNCDWWFTEEAIILDTAGRFSFQESTAPDRHEWEAFLKLLGRHRKECPINGVLVVIPATSLAKDPLEEQETKAKNIRKKLMQLQKLLDIRFPIFILITKADRVLGFAEFFDNVDPGYQHQIFGWSNPDTADQRWDPKSLDAIFEDIAVRIHKARLRFLARIDSTDKVDKMFVLPEELVALREPLGRYLHVIFQSSGWEEPLMFRGFFFTSGVQQGRPIARACQDLLRVSEGDSQEVLEDLETTFRRSRAFFIRDFYEKKVFPEQGLVKRTAGALKKEKRLRQAVWAGLAVAGLIFAFLLAPAVLNLMKMLGPINDLTEDATECLEEDVLCGVIESYELVYEIERARKDLADARWSMRLMLQGRKRNEIVNELLPTVQAGLLRKGVLGPVLASFDARSDPEMWRDGDGVDYDLFKAAFENRLRFDEYQTTRADRDLLRETTQLGPLLRFLEVRAGHDSTADGQEIDEWLADTSEFGDADFADEIFRAVATTDERFDLMKVGRLERPDRAVAAFERFWSVEVLAAWDFELIESYLRVYQETYEGLLDLQPGTLGGEAALAAFSDSARRIGNAFSEGQRHMATRAEEDRSNEVEEPLAEEDEETVADDESAEDAEEERPRRRRRTRRRVEEIAEGSLRPEERPGKDVESWRRFCREDYGALTNLHPNLSTEDQVESHCDLRIPDDWNRLVAARSDYDHLYEESQVGGRPLLTWSEDADILQTHLVELAELADPEAVLRESADLGVDLDQRTGDRARLSLIKSHVEDLHERLRDPVAELATFESRRPAAKFYAADGQRKAAEIAALATGLRVLPVVESYLLTKFDVDCASCFALDHAKTFVPPTNEFLGWSHRALGPARSVSEIQEPIDRINQAVYGYLETFLGRDRVVQSGFQFPHAAASAQSWPRFAAAVRRWRVVAPAGNVRTESGLTREVLRDFIKDNDRLLPLLERFGRSRGASRPAQLEPDLQQAIDEYRRTFDLLDDDALEAWRQLAREDGGALLEGFHAFSRTRSLRRDRQARDLVERVENHGAALLSAEIRPLFARRAEGFWRLQESCCYRRFPFISERELGLRRTAYERGQAEGRRLTDLWEDLRPERNGRRTISSIRLETVDKRDLDRLFYSGGELDRLFEEFAVDTMLEVDAEGRPLTTIDFLSPETDSYRALRDWQRFLYDESPSGRSGRRLIENQRVVVRNLGRASSSDSTYLGTQVGQVFFDGEQIRPSTDANRQADRELPLRLDDAPLTISGHKEGAWESHLELRGGPLKLLYFVQVAAGEGQNREGNRIWSIRIELPNPERPRDRFDAVFEVEFERPMPDRFPVAKSESD